MAHCKCKSSPALCRSFSIPKAPPQWRFTSCFSKSSYLANMVSPKNKLKQQNFMHGKAIMQGCYQWWGCTWLHLIQSPDFGNALPLGPYVACKTHCLGDYVNQHSPVHHPLETQYDQTNFFEQNFTKLSYKSIFAS